MGPQSMLQTLAFLARHPLTRSNPVAAFARFAAWQIGSRVVKDHVHNWVDDAKLVVRRGMTGATGNIYCGLHEFADMAFALHFLRYKDVFLDIGANIGSFTVLASKVCGADTIAFEPDPETAGSFRRNLSVNGIDDHVTFYESALGPEAGTAAFTVGQDTVNHVAEVANDLTRTVKVMQLDGVERAGDAILMKLDVEGYEAKVLEGAVRTLASPNLLAIETEAQEANVTGPIEAAGFVRRWYNPFVRDFAIAPITDLPTSNALFIRDEAFVLSRLKAAPRRTVLGRLI
jgi:FkbM family methyltransferase